MLADPAVSPFGNLVAVTVMTQDPDANQQRSAIWVVAGDGSAPPRQLTRGPRRDHRPRFSPDGTRLAFLANREQEWRNDLYILDLGGGEPTRAARLPRGIVEFDWSPDGSRLALLGRPDWPKDPDMLPAKDEEEARSRRHGRDGRPTVASPTWPTTPTTGGSQRWLTSGRSTSEEVSRSV